MLVQKAGEIPWDEMQGAEIVGLSAGASAPEILVNEIIEAFRERFDLTLELTETVKEDEEFLVARDLRDTELTASDMAFVNG
jgi:4-hydroxy-3-methylbut-2-enyl diphosphate reductase